MRPPPAGAAAGRAGPPRPPAAEVAVGPAAQPGLLGRQVLPPERTLQAESRAQRRLGGRRPRVGPGLEVELEGEGLDRQPTPVRRRLGAGPGVSLGIGPAVATGRQGRGEPPRRCRRQPGQRLIVEQDHPLDREQRPPGRPGQATFERPQGRDRGAAGPVRERASGQEIGRPGPDAGGRGRSQVGQGLAQGGPFQPGPIPAGQAVLERGRPLRVAPAAVAAGAEPVAPAPPPRRRGLDPAAGEQAGVVLEFAQAHRRLRARPRVEAVEQ
ncbi:MAG: hypothetical protein D6702_04475, partial [Planctomycetota bacterium]